jgi:hypothetical protein
MASSLQDRAALVRGPPLSAASATAHTSCHSIIAITTAATAAAKTTANTTTFIKIIATD